MYGNSQLRKQTSWKRNWLPILIGCVSAVSMNAAVNDATFNPSGSGANGSVYAVVQDPYGGLLIGGNFTTYNGVSRMHLVRCNANGTVDTTFTADADGDVYSIAVQGDTKIILGGAFQYVNGIYSPYLARLLPGGAFDTSFAPPRPNGFVHAVAHQPSDQKILIGGAFLTLGGSSVPYLARLTSTGARDTIFYGNPDNIVYAIKVNNIAGSPNIGKIYIGGSFQNVGPYVRPRIARLTSLGYLDSAFNPGTFNNAVYSIDTGMMVDAGLEEFVLMGGTFSGYASLMRADGSGEGLAGSIGSESYPTEVRSVRIASSTSLYVAGNITFPRKGIARWFQDGAGYFQVANWNNGPGPENATMIYAMALQTVSGESWPVIGGAFTTVDLATRGRVARLLPNDYD